MPLPDNLTEQDESFRKAVWLLIAVALNTLELFLPRIPVLPWLKPGLANCITIIWIIRYGAADALLLTLLRVWISSFYFGFSLVTMGLALSGGLLSTAIMAAAWAVAGRRGMLGTIGLGMLGAAAHNAGQLGAVYLLLTHNIAVFYQLPFMAGASLVFGGTVGAIVPALWRMLALQAPASAAMERHPNPVKPSTPQAPSWGSILIITGIIGGAIALLALRDLRLLVLIAIAVSVVAAGASGRGLGAFTYPLRMWAMFLFIGIVYLFFSYGTKIPGIPVVTYEGLTDTAAQSLRLWTWLEAGLLLQRLHSNHLLFSALGRLFPRHGTTLLAGLYALEYFPGVISFVKSKAAWSGLAWRSPGRSMALFIGRIQDYVMRTDREARP
jgi:heptaprenyl diphosphate synthase